MGVVVRLHYFQILTASLEFCAEQKGLQVYAYVIMPNHFHLICSQVNGKLSAVIGDMKQYTSGEIARKLEEDGRLTWLSAMRGAAGKSGAVKVWDEGCHPEQVHSRPFFNQKADYIHNNPVRAGFVADPCAWKYSSAAAYYGYGQSVVPLAGMEF
mgnify:CR=1 FL=1